jgi:SAM-dependent methyltransferase
MLLHNDEGGASMDDVESHYRDLLAPVYLWMAGGSDAALTSGASDLSDVQGQGGLAIDLGAGFGMHAIPLARAGYEVIAVDSSPQLLEQLKDLAGGLAIQPVAADLMTFEEYLPAGRQADLILCMGDTLTHLPEARLIERLASSVARALRDGGRFVSTFRDYTKLPSDTARFIPVRGDDRLILTCFLEDRGRTVAVHDILHRRTGQGWKMQVGQYTKLKLDPTEVKKTFDRCGLETTISAGPRGMVKLIASR